MGQPCSMSILLLACCCLGPKPKPLASLWPSCAVRTGVETARLLAVVIPGSSVVSFKISRSYDCTDQIDPKIIPTWLKYIYTGPHWSTVARGDQHRCAAVAYYSHACMSRFSWPPLADVTSAFKTIHRLYAFIVEMDVLWLIQWYLFCITDVCIFINLIIAR